MGRAWVVALAVLLVLTAIPAGAQPDLESARARLAEARERVAEAQKRADAAAAELSAAETALAEVELELERLEDAISLAESEIDGMREELRRFAIEQYVGRSDPPPFLASEEDLGAAVRAEALSEIVSGANGDVLDRYRLFAAELDTARKEAAERREQQEEALAALEEASRRIAADLASLQEEQQTVASLVARLEEEERRRIAEEEARRRAEEEARKAAEQRRIAQEAQERAEEVALRTPPSNGGSGGSGGSGPSPRTEAPRVETPSTPIATGDFVCPVQGAVSFTDSFGAPRSGGRRHKGVDMMAASGTPVVAPVSGVVAHRGNSIGGLSFHLDGDDGNYYYGTHLSAYGNSGRVQAGTIVGYVGATGNATTPHLHFEIHPGGRGNAVNPYSTVRAVC